VSRHDRLRPLSSGKISSQRDALEPALGIRRNFQLERCAGVIVPDLDCIVRESRNVWR
jgi:hypothetical protein